MCTVRFPLSDVGNLFLAFNSIEWKKMKPHVKDFAIGINSQAEKFYLVNPFVRMSLDVTCEVNPILRKSHTHDIASHT